MSIMKQLVNVAGIANYNRQANAPVQWTTTIPRGSMLLPMITVPLEQVDGFMIHYMTAPLNHSTLSGKQEVLVLCATEDLFITDELFNSMFLGTYMEQEELVYIFANLLT